MSDIVDSGKELVYSIDLPGVMEHDIQVECKADRLWVSGLRKNDLAAKGKLFESRGPVEHFRGFSNFPARWMKTEFEPSSKKVCSGLPSPRVPPNAARIE